MENTIKKYWFKARGEFIDVSAINEVAFLHSLKAVVSSEVV